jgi:predicted small metal-binding protein
VSKVKVVISCEVRPSGSPFGCGFVIDTDNVAEAVALYGLHMENRHPMHGRVNFTPPKEATT